MPDSGTAQDHMLERRLKDIWNQQVIPIVLRRTGKGERLRVRLPFADANREWLRDGKRACPTWVSNLKCWELPKKWFNSFVERAIVKFGRVYIIQPFHEQEVCAPACQNAKGHECQCSCMGEHHGVGNDGSWFEVSDAFATRWGERHLACRLLTRKHA